MDGVPLPRSSHIPLWETGITCQLTCHLAGCHEHRTGDPHRRAHIVRGTRQTLFDKTVSALTGVSWGWRPRGWALQAGPTQLWGAVGQKGRRRAPQMKKQVNKASGRHSQAGLAEVPEAGRPHGR